MPSAGEIFVATENDKEAKQIAQAYVDQGKDKLLEETKAKKLSLDGLFSQIQAGNVKELNLIIKADVQGSVEAVKQSLVKLSNEEVAVRVIHGGVGAINESDVSLASASNAIIIGFNIRLDNAAKETADRENVDVRLYRVIYDAIEDVEAAMKGMLEPIYEKKYLVMQKCVRHSRLPVLVRLPVLTFWTVRLSADVVHVLRVRASRFLRAICQV